MTRADDKILEFLLNEGNKPIIATPSVIAINIDFTSDYIRRRVRVLLKQSLIEYEDEDKGMYRITDKGRAYLAGELDKEDLEDDTDQ